MPRVGRRGVTLVELLVAMTIASAVGAALIKVMLTQSRATRQNEAWREARMVSRGSVNRLLNDLRSVEATGGLENAASDGRSITLRIPYAIGIACTGGTNPLIVSLLPRNPDDSTSFAGFAWRNAASGAYSYINTFTAPTVITPPSAACTLQGVETVPASGPTPAGAILSMPWGSPDANQRAGNAVLLYQRVRYRFAPSVAIDSAFGLFRAVNVSAGSWLEEELAAPFDSSARFGLILMGQDTAATAIPGSASWVNVRGVQVDLDGMSELSGIGGRKHLNVRTAVFFKNRAM
jgi:prepilin-type N-terminal cleavage/methylation domain-containing protein